MDRLYDRFLGKAISVSDINYGEWMPLVESFAKGNNLVFKCEPPGVDSKDVDVFFDKDTHQLVIKGDRKMKKNTQGRGLHLP